MTAPPLHTRLMAEALVRAPSRGGWLHLPDLPVDYRNPGQAAVAPFGTAGRDRPALASLAMIATRLPSRIAYADAARSLRFDEVVPAVGRLAARIRAVGSEGPVGLLLPGNVGAPVALLGCLAAGRPSVLLDAAHPPPRNAALLARAGARLVVAPAAVAPPGFACVPLEAAFERGDAPPPGEGAGLDQLAFILGTSGSTGEPKMIAYSERGILQQTRIMLDGMRVGPTDRCLLPIPPASIAGLVAMLMPLHGCTVDLLPLTDIGFRELRERMRTHPPSILRAGPSLLRAIARLPDAKAMLGSLRALRASGEPLLRADLELARRCLPPDCTVHNRYGSTELIGTSWIPGTEDDHDPVRTAAGLPDPEVEVKLVDETGAPCPSGEPGELWMRGRYAALGEWTADGLVPGRLERDPDDPALRVYRTGDLARLAPDGAIVVLGRLDRMVKVNGHRVELAEVETALRRSEEVRQVAVVARQDAARVTLHAFVVAAPGVAPGLEARLRQALRGSLPGYMVPAGIVLLDALPQLPGGKLDERALLASLPSRG